jgi:hypothetical protein
VVVPELSLKEKNVALDPAVEDTKPQNENVNPVLDRVVENGIVVGITR